MNPTPSSTSQENTRRLFKSTISSCKYFFKNGKAAVFRMGTYITEDAAEIAELDAEIKAGHPNIYVDKNEVFAAVDRDDPIAALRKRIAAEERAKVLAEMAAATDPSRDLGTSEQGKLNPASTSDIAPVTANGDATARLQAARSKAASSSQAN